MYFATGFEIPLTELVLEGFTDGGATITAAESHKDLSGNGGSSSLTSNFNIFSLPPSADQDDTKWLSFAVKITTATQIILKFIDSLSAVNASLRLGQTAGAADMSFYRESLFTLLATTTSPLTAGVWYWIDIEIKVHDSTGVLNVYINGSNTPTLTYSGDTKYYANDGFNKVSFQPLGVAYFDDIILSSAADGRPAYECFLKKISPNADGSHIGLTPSTGSNYTCVDETTPSDVDYNQGNAADDYDLYNFTSLGYTPVAIKGVVVHTRTAKDGIITRARAKCLSSGVGADGAYVTIASSYSTNQTIFTQDPNTASDWTESTINAAEFGVQFDEAT